MKKNLIIEELAVPLCRDISGAGTILISSAEDLNLECTSELGKLKRAVIPVMLGNLDFYVFEVALREGDTFFPKCCCFRGAGTEASSAGSCACFPGAGGD